MPQALEFKIPTLNVANCATFRMGHPVRRLEEVLDTTHFVIR